MPTIPAQRDQIWFRSTFFEVEPGEDSETNPRCYGRALARWLASALPKDGLPVAEVFPEDWGWCVMVKAAPFRLWVGCGNVDDLATQTLVKASSHRQPLVWTCIVAAEVPVWRRLFGAPDTTGDVRQLVDCVRRTIASAPNTTLMQGPEGPLPA